jgi:hypothetical protein
LRSKHSESKFFTRADVRFGCAPWKGGAFQWV